MSQTTTGSQQVITASWTTAAGARREQRTTAFCVGLDGNGELSIDDQQVTLGLAAVFRRDGRWWVRDLGSSQGTLLDGAPVQSAALPARGVLGFGNTGPSVMLEFDDAAPTVQRPAGTGKNPEKASARTVLGPSIVNKPGPPAQGNAPPISVRIGAAAAAAEFSDTIRVGRGENCTIRLDDDSVSRLHAEIYRMGGHWCVRDLGSSNGTYVDGARVEQAVLPGRCTVRMGIDGPQLELDYAAPQAAPGASTPLSVDEVAARYFDKNSKRPAGHHTMMVRQAFSTVQKKQKRKYGSFIAGAVALLLVAVAVGIYQQVQLQRTRAIAEQMFYNMKTMELQLARLEDQVQASADAGQHAQAEQGRTKLAEMATQYDALLEELGVAGGKMPPEDRLIIKVARTFGECELGMPKGFVDEVKRYIDRWRSDERLLQGLQQAREQNLAPIVTRVMTAHHLPPQFFYVALQESDFRRQAVGPETRFGIAKGMWQFMPETAEHYGLRLGPLRSLPQYDPDDERFDPAAATQAAARYLGDLYRGEAQASALLVLASYNWGTTRVRKRILAMKENPRDRNFWALLAQSDIPKETRDYVFLIFAAAVIGEDPKLFGFDFEQPLGTSVAAPAKN
jgi:pSer/pThr/pTyr-binding forkhead associated (FHA) protein